MSFTDELRAFAGRECGPASSAQDAVNLPMIRHWVEAMGDTNPIYTDDAAAQETGRAGVIAPPTMLQAWTMRGYAASRGQASPDAAAKGSALTDLLELLAEHGFTSVVATDCEQDYERELQPGDHLTMTETIEAVSDQKTTGLGIGHFVTTVKTYRDQHGATVGTQRWRTLRFRPGTGTVAAISHSERTVRPRPALNRDNAFWFDAAREHRLLIQRCTSCGTLRHPTAPCCAQCQSFEWDTLEASGRGVVYSFVVNHHPKVDAFDYPLVVVLVELAEGVRLVANVVGVEPASVSIGMPVVLDWIDADPELSLPAFRPAERSQSQGER